LYQSINLEFFIQAAGNAIIAIGSDGKIFLESGGGANFQARMRSNLVS